MKEKIVWMGMGGNRVLAERLWPIIKELGADLRIISEWEPNEHFPDIEYKKWSLETWRKDLDLIECDVAIAPQRVEEQPAKSNVKLAAYMSCGLPVVASPIQAYREIIIHDHNGYIASTEQEWKEHLNTLLYCTDEFRERMSKNAVESVKKFSPDNIAALWMEVVQSM